MFGCVEDISVWVGVCELRTDLVQFDGVEFRARVGEQLLGVLAVRAVGLAEDGDGVLVDDGLDFCLCGGHCGGGGAAGAAEEAADEGGNGCGFFLQERLLDKSDRVEGG